MNSVTCKKTQLHTLLKPMSFVSSSSVSAFRLLRCGKLKLELKTLSNVLTVAVALQSLFGLPIHH
jgi:hypothetical protein